MKKKLLFVMNNLHCGGAEKALISLFEMIDYDRFEVDLLLFKQEGMFLSSVPAQVNLVEGPSVYHYFDGRFFPTIKKCLKEKRFRLALARVMAGFIYKTESNKAICEQRVWKHIGANIRPLEKEYDAVIGYLEKSPIYYAVEKVKANTKIGFIHNDYQKLGMDENFDQLYFEKLHSIVTVSEKCATVLKRVFPSEQDKVKVMYNIISPAVLRKLARNKVEIIKKDLTIISIGRLAYQKGYELAILACEQLVHKGMKVKWYVIGEGEEREKLEQLIAEKNLQDHFILLGVKENPYPYMEEADLYVQTSRFEGKSIAIDEAKILRKPIIVTNFSTVQDQIQHKINGYIVGMSPNAIAEGIHNVFHNEALKNQFIKQLSSESLGTEAEINKLYDLVHVG
ncbi:glycosyltransferase [Alkalihalobacillus pseudalcaliphilus]|uniref:glycosyltransferase n=1 Tax=Alkalihalobacillus pseudalcaliphilus TaxID=79884 RepID=UPI00064DEAB2|nr:glycosyltransferase [Alkalihalobacillus pseudalcaliphilus]KMK75032.1 glycosyl transferase family 1 [Alkalihalobacillus pseudalcaliphilus]